MFTSTQLHTQPWKLLPKAAGDTSYAQKDSTALPEVLHIPLEPAVVLHLPGSWPDPRHSEGCRDEHSWVYTQAEPCPGAPWASPARNLVPPAHAALNPQLWVAASLLLLVPPNPAHPLWSSTPKAAEAGQGRQAASAVVQTWKSQLIVPEAPPACTSGRRKADGHHLHLTNLALVSLQS